VAAGLFNLLVLLLLIILRAFAERCEGWSFFYNAPVLDWAYLAGACILACLLDYFVFQMLPINLLWHGVILGCWVVAAGLFNLLVLTRMGEQHAVMWTAGYVLEWMLSMDNLFVFHLIFRAYRTPANQVHKAIFVGIIGAILLRMLFFMVLSELLSFFGWMRWPFGALLIWSGFETARSSDDDGADVKDTRLIRFLKWVLGDRLRESYDKNGRMFVQDAKTGRVQVTLLFIVVACVELTDIVFALDSVSAKVAQLPDSYVAFSSSVLAMFGLRAMFFIVKDLVDMFSMLKYGLCLILVFIGAELMFSKFIRVASSTVCITIVAVFVVCIAASYTTHNNQAFADTRSGECGREPDQATRGT
jgi:tellurite resistance protein TerC